MAAFEVAAGAMVLTALATAVWAALPSVLVEAESEEEEDPAFTRGDVAIRLAALEERVLRDDDDPTPWTRAPLADRPALPAALQVAEVLAIAEGTDPTLLPIGACLLSAHDSGPVLRGRRQGRPLHAVQLTESLYIDLIAAAKLVPPIALELEAKGLAGPIALYSPKEVPHVEAGIVAAWLLSGEGRRVVSEDPGERSFRWEIAGHTLIVHAWMPSVIAGIREDQLRPAAIASLGDERAMGAIQNGDLEDLQHERLAPVGWTRDELLEVAAITQQLESQDVDVSPFLLEVFSDRVAPMPNLHDEREFLVTSALMNWVGAAHRRAGRARAAVAALNAALSVSSPVDDDNRGDIHHNLGLAWLDLRRVEPEALQRSFDAFSMSARLHPHDAHPWVQMALIHHLQGQTEHANDAWRQAATRAPHTDLYAVFMANAGADTSG